MKMHNKAPEKRLAQKTLAKSLTELIHGEQKADEAEQKTIQLFQRSKKSVKELTLGEFEEQFQSV